jgi:TrwC relaxase
MSIHKLSAGSGYDYLTRQVAALDATEKGRVGLASYYTERGETPGAWIGSGVVGIDGLNAGDAVTAEQMRALFGAGMHPLAAQRLEQLEAADLTDANIKSATRLGAPFKVYAGEVSPFRIEVAKRIAARQAGAGEFADESVSAALRAQVRTEVAREYFRKEHGRDPMDAREIAATIAKQSRPRTQTVAGYDLTFSPVKSVSSLWAVADPHVAAQIERAHRAAVQDALHFIERHALFTRQGRNGIRQVNVHGLVAAAFTHRDSRAGDPDLHTHVAVANKVQRTAWNAEAANTLGGPEAIQAMITHALNPSRTPSLAVDADWVAATAEKVLAAVEERRSTWQSWHIRAEAHRHVRAADIATDKVDQLVELLVTEVLQTRSISLTRPDDGITEPVVLRRAPTAPVSTRLPDPSCSPLTGSWPPSSDSSSRRVAPTAASWTPPLSS